MRAYYFLIYFEFNLLTTSHLYYDIVELLAMLHTYAFTVYLLRG